MLVVVLFLLFSYQQLCQLCMHIIDDFETNTLEVFLAKNRFSNYVEKFLEGGCDDFSFIINLDESAILEMQKDGMECQKVCGCKVPKGDKC